MYIFMFTKHLSIRRGAFGLLDFEAEDTKRLYLLDRCECIL